ncbi:MAG: hypothetical protein NTX40_11140 [Planctomycetota bacterium]|nr:hypothetical protein [Planctomycetota bacterium]
MARCDACKKRSLGHGLNRRLAIPEYRAMVGIWPWITVRVCDACLEAHERDFLDRLRLLAPQVLENDEPIVAPVCLACGAVESAGGWREASKWLDAAGQPVRRARFHLCGKHASAVYIDGIVVSSNLSSAERLAEALDELPAAGADLLARVEGWRPGEAAGPAEATHFKPDFSRDAAAAEAFRFWQEAPAGLEAKAAWMGPVRKDYRMRYRLDLVRNYSDGRRESLILVRTGPAEWTTYGLSAAP